MLVGPTASGKSAVAVEIAQRFGDLELVSVDSMQVYRGMDIGTAKVREPPHHLVDLASPSEDFSVARYQAAARDVLAGIEARGHRALLVGGTGLYMQAVVDGLTVPGAWPQLRAQLEREDPAALFAQLQQADPVAAARIEPGNTRRVVRALEVTVGSGRPFSSYGPGIDAYPRSTRFRLAGLWLPRPVANARIEARYWSQMDGGLLDEVRALDAVTLSRTARQALGYRELLDHLAGRRTLQDALDEAIKRTREFARRQRMWFRRDPRIVWFGAARNPFDALPALLGHWTN